MILGGWGYLRKNLWIIGILSGCKFYGPEFLDDILEFRGIMDFFNIFFFSSIQRFPFFYAGYDFYIPVNRIFFYKIINFADIHSVFFLEQRRTCLSGIHEPFAHHVPNHGIDIGIEIIDTQTDGKDGNNGYQHPNFNPKR